MFKVQYPWKYRWKHRNLVLIFVATAIAVYIASTPQVAQLVEQSGSFGYFGALIAGFFFSSLFTVPISAVVLVLLGKAHNALLIALIGSFGSTIADFMFFRIARKSIDKLSEEMVELRLLIERHNPFHFSKDNKTVQKIKLYMLPVLAGMIIASPLPDEIAMSVLGAVNYSKRKVLILAFVANFIGIFALVTLGRELF